MNPEKFLLPPHYKQFESNMWLEYMQIGKKHNALNLGHGFPDFTAPKVLSDTLAKVSEGTDPVLHQYARDSGTPRLVTALSKLYSPFFKREINPLDEILITNGAMEALYCILIGFIHKGDEVIIIEPYYSRYEYLVKIAGGTPRYIPLKPKKGSTASSDWVLDFKELESMFTSKTKMIIVNTPHNPTGKVFTETELKQIADLCIKWDVLCLADEVYEWLVYKPSPEHFRIATLPGMWDRTLTIGSAGKTFSATGWRIGWTFAPTNLLHNLRVVHQNIVNSCGAPMQDALARALEHEESILGTKDSILYQLVTSFEKKRDYFAGVLKEVGLDPVVPDGGYFMLADWSKLASNADLDSETDKYRDYRFTKWLGKNVGLLLFPMSPFYSEANKHLGENYVRLCFIKEDENLEKAGNILKKWTKN